MVVFLLQMGHLPEGSLLAASAGVLDQDQTAPGLAIGHSMAGPAANGGSHFLAELPKAERDCLFEAGAWRLDISRSAQ
jgi:hypothetical protein